MYIVIIYINRIKIVLITYYNEVAGTSIGEIANIVVVYLHTLGCIDKDRRGIN